MRSEVALDFSVASPMCALKETSAVLNDWIFCGRSVAMSKSTKTKRDDPERSKLFIEKAREIGADQDKSAADELLGHLHGKPPEPHTQSQRKKRRNGRVAN
jgi:hypothetical protein